MMEDQDSVLPEDNTPNKVIPEIGPQFVFPNVVIDTLSISSIQNENARFSLDKLANVTANPKSWINNVPKVVANYQVELDSESQVEAVLITKDILLWTNVCLLQELYITYDNFPRFASLMGPQVKILKLDKFFGSIPEISFISCCKSLKSLKILQLDVRRGPRMLLPSEFPNLNQTFGGVKSLVIENIFFDHPKQLEFYKNFLNRFPKLEQIYIPHPHGPTQTKWETLKLLQSKYLIKPVIDYLNERHNNMMMPTNPMRRTINAAGIYSSVFPELAQACAKNGAFLTNINQKQIESLFLTQDTTLGKILFLNDGLNDRRLLTRWINLEKVSLRTSACDIRSEITCKGKVQYFPQLKSIALVLDSESKTDPEFLSLNRVLKLLLGQPRLGVKELSLHWPPFGHDTPANVIVCQDIVKNLPNILKFHANNWKASNDDLIELLNGLKQLQHLAIEDCPLFTEFGLIGPNVEQPIISQLKDLKHVEIVNRSGSGSILDTCFQIAFQNIPLKTFVFDPNPNLVTKIGYSALIQGVFAESIEIFPNPKSLPSDMTQETFEELRSHFKNFTCPSSSICSL